MIISLRDYEIKKDAFEEKTTEIVLNMLQENFDYDVIHKITNVPLEEIERIRQEYHQ